MLPVPITFDFLSTDFSATYGCPKISYIEKPMGIAIHQARSLAHLAQENGCFTQVSHQRRSAPLLRRLRDACLERGPIVHGLVEFYRCGFPRCLRRQSALENHLQPVSEGEPEAAQSASAQHQSSAAAVCLRYLTARLSRSPFSRWDPHFARHLPFRAYQSWAPRPS